MNMGTESEFLSFDLVRILSEGKGFRAAGAAPNVMRDHLFGKEGSGVGDEA